MKNLNLNFLEMDPGTMSNIPGMGIDQANQKADKGDTSVDSGLLHILAVVMAKLK